MLRRFNFHQQIFLLKFWYLSHLDFCYPGWYHDHPACVLISIPGPGDPCIVPDVTSSLWSTAAVTVTVTVTVTSLMR